MTENVSADPVMHPQIEEVLTRMRGRDEMPRVFAVVTWGCAATNWFAKVLNAHPDILSLHSLRTRLQLVSPTMDRVDEADLLRMLQILGMGYSLIGDVHGVNRESIPLLQAAFRDEFRSACLIREPLRRLRSQFALFETVAFDFTRWGDIGYIKKLPGYEEIDSLVGTDSGKSCFVHSANMLNSIIEEAKLLPRFFQHEEITTSADELIGAIDYLSAGSVSADEEFAAGLLRTSAINSHRKAGQQVIFNDWQIRIIQSIVQPEAWRLYAEHGYQTPEFVSAD